MNKVLMILCLLMLSCGPSNTIRLTEAQLQEDGTEDSGTFDSLHAYRKKPGEPKTVQVQGYYRADSTYVEPHTRTKPTKQ